MGVYYLIAVKYECDTLKVSVSLLSMSHEKVIAELTRGDHISIIALFDFLLSEAKKNTVSDIHIDPYDSHTRIRFRIDGVLQDAHIFPKNIHPELISRVKVLSKLRTDDHHGTHDGRFQFVEEDGSVDVRVSIIPTYYGESVVLRLLASVAEYSSLESLGFSLRDISIIETVLKKTHGMILVTGPTGSGKTTTLYTLIQLIHRADVSIITIEDPIEYAVPNIKQIQIHNAVGLSFPHILRSVLRQDPNIIMVGEIRDSETARIAVNTALTGHLLLSTLHTNDSATALPRLIDMGIEAYLIASTVNIIIAQRLVRKLCTKCKKSLIQDSVYMQYMRESFGRYNFQEAYTSGPGCEVCSSSGFIGRIPIYEVLQVDSSIRDAIIQKRSASEMHSLAKAAGMKSLFEDGMNKVEKGITSFEEVLRVIHE